MHQECRFDRCQRLSETDRKVVVMSVLKCGVKLSDGCFITCDGIAHAGKLWLVPGWIPHPVKPVAMPKRMIRFDCFPHEAEKGRRTAYQNIQLPIQESALLGQLPPGIEYVDQPPHISVPVEELRKQYV
jgi:hypothetical protein